MIVELAFAAALMALQAPASAAPMKLQFPVRCTLGETCEVQNYVDRDAGPGAVRDYRGGAVTYDAHNGTDIRLPNMAAQRRGVEVLAAASGRVLRVRDGVADRSVRETGTAAVASVECGNGVVIEHAGGLQTQYCHMAQGSVRVKPGDVVQAGQAIGAIGLSGQTEYPHLHFTVRRGGAVVDPFGPSQVLWSAPPAYRAGLVLNTGFSTGPVAMEAVEAGEGLPQPSVKAPALVAYVRAINLQGGDEPELILRDPQGAVLFSNRSKPLDRNKAQSLIFGGKKAPPQGWAKGTYLAEYKVWRGGRVALQRQFRTTL